MMTSQRKSELDMVRFPPARRGPCHTTQPCFSRQAGGAILSSTSFHGRPNDPYEATAGQLQKLSRPPPIPKTVRRLNKNDVRFMELSMSWLMMGDYGAEMLADVIKV